MNKFIGAVILAILTVGMYVLIPTLPGAYTLDQVKFLYLIPLFMLFMVIYLIVSD